MVKCFAPGCTSGQANSKEKVFLFKPSAKEIVLKWSKMIPRLDRTFSENDYLCMKHFDEKDIIREEIIDNVLYRRMQPKLVKNAIPKFFNFPTKVSNTRIQHKETDNSFVIKTRKTCIACNCSELIKNGRKISYYLFPINPKLRKEWISAAQIKNSNLSEFTFLCSKHFEEHCFENVTLGTLKEDAIPSRFGFVLNSSNKINLSSSSSTGNTEAMVIDLTETSTGNSNLKNDGIIFCIVKNCKHKGNIPGITYHRIPKNNYETWMKALKNFVKIDPVPTDSRVCSMHFKAKDFILQGNKIKLNNEAVPKLHMNKDETSSSTFTDNGIKQEDSTIIYSDNNIKKLRQSVLLSSVITPPADIVKSDFALIDINSIINKTNNTVTQKTNNSTQNLSIIKAMHNYCNDESVMKIINIEKSNTKPMETVKSVPDKEINKKKKCEDDEEEKKKNRILRKLCAYKKAYKYGFIISGYWFDLKHLFYRKHKSVSRKQGEHIITLENKLEENMERNQKLEQRITILEDIIQKMLKQREDFYNIDSLATL